MPFAPPATTFSRSVKFRADAGVVEAVELAARRNRTTAADYMRRALREKLEADGVSLPPVEAPTRRQAA